MSPCEKYQELISRMVDGELTAREEADLADHIESCTACAALFRAFSAISEQIGGDLEDAPLDLRENVMAEIRREEIRKKNRIPTIFRAVMSTAACAAIVFGVYLGVTLTKKAQISTAAYQDAPAAAEERMVLAAESAPEALETEEAAEEALPEEEPAPTPMPDAAPAEAAEEPAAPMLGAGAAAAADEPKEADADNVAAFDAKEEEETPVWDFSHWDLSLFRELLGGEEAGLTREELEPSLIGCAMVRSGSELAEFRLYALDETLYYYDPVRDAVFEAELSLAQWTEFLG